GGYVATWTEGPESRLVKWRHTQGQDLGEGAVLWFQGALSLFLATQQRQPPSNPSGRGAREGHRRPCMTDRLIAIGDIDGCSKALATVVEAIQPKSEDTLVFLGDYIDRGPDSKGVVDQISALSQRCTVVPLLGNHEEMLLAVLQGGPSETKFWLTFCVSAGPAPYVLA